MVKLEFIVVLSLVLSQCYSAISGQFVNRLPRLDGRIVGGYAIDITDAPYTASLQTRSHTCGASIISEKWLLTAAHCTDGRTADDFKVRTGSTTHAENGTLTNVARIVQHKKFDFFSIDYDFSLLELENKLTFDSTTQRIKLPSANQNYPDNTVCLVSGWGTTQNSNESRASLRAAIVPTVNQATCAKAYTEFTAGITDRMICAGLLPDGGKDACQGDSGGPLVTSGTLIGVVSWGYGCARPHYPGVYSRVASVRYWIKINTGI